MAEEKPKKALLNTLDYIQNNTCPELQVPLSTVEAYYISNWAWLSKSIELRMNNGHIIELPVYKLKFYLDRSYLSIRDVVRGIAIKYSIDIPFRETFGEGEEITVNK